MNNKKRFKQVVKDIKAVRIQGARNIAKAALYAYSINPTKRAKNKLLKARPTEPMLENVLRKIEKEPHRKILNHFDEAQEKINKNVLKLIKSDSVVFTHCHSTNVLNALVYAKKKGKKFQVYHTESRPLFQGYKTAKDLRKAKIKSTMFVDSAAGIALERKQGTRKVDVVFLGADAILKTGVINKVGSGMFSEIAKKNKIPVYIVADSWKYSPEYVKIEQRAAKEIWKNPPKNVKIKNPAFEKIDRKYIKGIISELGILSYGDFLRKVKRN